MNEGPIGFVLGLLAALVVCIMISAVKTHIDDQKFSDLTSVIVLYEKCDGKSLESKKTAYNKCSKIMLENGYVPMTMEVESHYGHFIRVEGAKKEN